MASSFAAALLDELMGRNRNSLPNEQVKELRWDDDEVCKYHLCGFCPYELFTNTRADLGPCLNIHDDELRKAYEKSSRYYRMGYEADLVKFLQQNIISEVDRKIKRGQARLALSASGAIAAPQNAREEKIAMLTAKINDLVDKAEALGCEGKVEEAQGVMKLCDQLREERTQLEHQEYGGQMSNQAKEMEVCLICGAFLVKNDAPQRVEEHISGKQHIGYAKVRDYLKAYSSGELRRKTQDDSDRTRDKGDARSAKDRADREREREKEREERRRKDEEERKVTAAREEERKEFEAKVRREKEEKEQRDLDEDKRRKEKLIQDERDREKRRTAEKKRSRSRSSGRRRSRSRSRRSRSRERDRSRRRSRENSWERRRRDDSREKRRRDESRERKRRSRSRDHRRSRSRSYGRNNQDKDRREKRLSRESDRDNRKSKDRDSKDRESRHRSRERKSDEKSESLMA